MTSNSFFTQRNWNKFLKSSLYCAVLFFKNQSYSMTAEERLPNEKAPLYEKNYIKVDPMFWSYENITASNSNYNQNNIQVLTTRPNILIYINTKNLIFRPNISLDLSTSVYQGSFIFGYLLKNKVEIGLFTSLNYSENTTGSSSSKNGTMQSQANIGPSLIFYPIDDEKRLLSLNLRATYQQASSKRIISGATSNISDQKGFHIFTETTYSISLSEKIYYSPSLSIGYFFTQDNGGGNTTRSGIQIQAIPLSLAITI